MSPVNSISLGADAINLDAHDLPSACKLGVAFGSDSEMAGDGEWSDTPEPPRPSATAGPRKRHPVMVVWGLQTTGRDSAPGSVTPTGCITDDWVLGWSRRGLAPEVAGRAYNHTKGLLSVQGNPMWLWFIPNCE